MSPMRNSLPVFFVLLACSRKQPPETRLEASSPAAVIPSSAPAPLFAGPKTYRRQSAFATFEKNTMARCYDVTIEVTPVDAGPGFQERFDAMTATFGKPQDKDAVPIAGSCAETFPDRTTLASCALSQRVERDGGTPNTLHIDIGYFDYDTLSRDDAILRGCLRMGGKWSAVGRDSSEWHAAQLEHDRRSLGRLMKE